MKSTGYTIIIFLVLTMLFWAVNFHVTKICLEYYSPMGVAAWRFLFAVIVLVGFCVAQPKRRASIKAMSKSDLLYVFLVAFFGTYLTIYFFNKGLMTTSAINGSLIVALSPMITAVISLFALQTRIKALQWLAVLGGFVGVTIVLVRGNLDALMALDFHAGDLFILLMATGFSISQILVHKYLKHVDSISLTTVGSVFAFILFLISAGTNLTSSSVPSDSTFWASILFMGIFGTGVGYVAFYLAVVRLGATTTALYMNLIPFFAVLLAIPFGEVIQLAQLVGGAIIIGSLILFNRAKVASL